MSEVGVMHLLDTLALGGAERAAVNLVNELPRDKYRPYLCTTRSEGPLREAVARGVARTALERKSRFDHRPIRRLVEFIRKQKIEILHAHGSTLFVAATAAWFPPHPIVIWHAHYGRVALENRRAWAHRIALRRACGVITVNQQLAEWCGRRLCFPLEKIWCIPKMVRTPETRLGIAGLPGRVRYYGCPAEEAAAGKSFMVKGGAFADVDAAVSWHPASVTGVRIRSRVSSPVSPAS